MRVIEAENDEFTDVSEKEAEAIQQAIYRGKLVARYGNVEEQGAEACVTEYTDPSDPKWTRYAVEVWHGVKKWTRDWTDKSEAEAYYRDQLDRFGI